MASPAVDVSSGITIVFGTSSFSAEIVDVDWSGISREVVDTTHQGSTTGTADKFGGRTFAPSDIPDAGEMTFSIHFNPDTDPPTGTAAETITITWPSTATWAGSGFVTNYEASAPLDDKMTGSVTVKWTGEIAVTAAV